MYEKFLPKFAVVEVGKLLGHKIGHDISQAPAYINTDSSSTRKTIASVDKNGYKFVENGVIVGLGADGLLSNYDKTLHKQPCLVYDDELITGPLTSLDKYATPAEKDKEVYVRAIPLYVGDCFTTDNFSGELVDGTAGVTNGILTIGAENPMFIVKKSTLPNGKPAGEFTYIGA